MILESILPLKNSKLLSYILGKGIRHEEKAWESCVVHALSETKGK